MVCIYCDSKIKTSVVNSRSGNKGRLTWRRRQCKHCTSIMTTREQVDLEIALRVSGSNGLKPFLRDQLFIDVYNSVSHRKTALADAGKLTDTIITRLLDIQAAGILNRQQIIKTTGATLQRFDPAAGVHYQARHH